MNYYEQLGIAVDSDFTAVKKAYYRRAKECHPDLFGNAPEKAEEFKRLVMIFDTLSDPVKRRSYDETILVESRISYAAPCGADSIMDTGADDTLEELIVGNDPPEDTRLTTLFLDLEKTFVFMTCREAKNLQDCLSVLHKGIKFHVFLYFHIHSSALSPYIFKSSCV